MRTNLLMLLLAGCFSPHYQNGNLRCPDHECPRGYHCAVDGTCWQNGADPAAALPDLSMNDGDGGTPPGDGSTPPGDGGAPPYVDLAIPPPLVYPPASVWIAGSGGGSPRLNVCSGGSSVAGSSRAPSGASVSFGYFSSGTN
jgi:hypothetical protein